MDISRPLPFSALALAGAGLAGIPAALAIPNAPGADPTGGVENARAMFTVTQAEQTGVYLALVFGVVSAGLLLAGLPALLGLASRAGRRSVLASVAVVVTTLGALGYVGLNGAGAGSLYTLSNGAVDAATAARIWVTSNGLGLGIFALSFFVFLTLGLVLMAVALFRAGLAPRWAAVLLGVGVVAQGFPTSGLAAKFLPLPLAVALLVLGVVALRRGGESELNPQPEPPGVAAVAPQTARTAS